MEPTMVKYSRPIPPSAGLDRFSVSTGPPKPYHLNRCPGEWRYWCVLVLCNGEEQLHSNVKARTAIEAKRKVTVSDCDVREVRQQPDQLIDDCVEAWWDRDIPHFTKMINEHLLIIEYLVSLT